MPQKPDGARQVIFDALLSEDLHEKRSRESDPKSSGTRQNRGASPQGSLSPKSQKTFDRAMVALTPSAHQAVVRIYQTTASLQNHLEYIAREHKAKLKSLSLENEQGDAIHGREHIADMVNEWKIDIDPDVPQTPKTKITMQIPGYAAAKTEDARRLAYQNFKARLTALLEQRFKGQEYRIDKGRSAKLKEKMVVTLGMKDGKLLAESELAPVFGAIFDLKFGDNKSANYIQTAEKRKTRDSFCLVLSTPNGSKLAALDKAVRNFAAKEFKNSRYVYVIHTDTKYPHAHLILNSTDMDGRKMDPKKKDLARWRRDYAAACRKQGIALEASPCIDRGVVPRNTPQKIVQARARYAKIGKTLRIDKADQLLLAKAIKIMAAGKKVALSDREKALLETNRVSREQYKSDAKILSDLANQTKNKDHQKILRQTAKAIYRFSVTMPKPKVRLRTLLEKTVARDRSADRDRGR